MLSIIFVLIYISYYGNNILTRHYHIINSYKEHSSYTSSAITEEDLQRKIPANFNAEQMLLRAILINSELIEQVGEFLKPEHFYEILHQKIYNAIEILNEKGLKLHPHHY